METHIGASSEGGLSPGQRSVHGDVILAACHIIISVKTLNEKLMIHIKCPPVVHMNCVRPWSHPVATSGFGP